MDRWEQATQDAVLDLAAGNTNVEDTMERLRTERYRMEDQHRATLIKQTWWFIGLVALAAALLCWVLSNVP